MQESTLRALKTICGAIHYTLTRYHQREIGPRDWEYLCSYLELDKASLYGIELNASGFILWSKTLTFRYRGSQFHQQRKVEIHHLTT